MTEPLEAAEVAALEHLAAVRLERLMQLLDEQAEIWDQAYKAGVDDQRVAADEPMGHWIAPDRVNPYRTRTTTKTQGMTEPLNREALERLCAQILDEGQADTTAEVQLALAVRRLAEQVENFKRGWADEKARAEIAEERAEVLGEQRAAAVAALTDIPIGGWESAIDEALTALGVTDGQE